MEVSIDGYEVAGIANLLIDEESQKLRWQTIVEVPNDENELEEKTTNYEIGMPLNLSPINFPKGTQIIIYKPKELENE